MSSKDDWIPINDSEFRAWICRFLSELPAHLTDFGLSPSDIASITSDADEFDAALSEHIHAHSLAQAATQRKKAARTALESGLREIVRRINNHPAMTNPIRARFGLRERKPYRSRVTAGSETPRIHLETRTGAVVVHFGTNPQNELRNGKPKWALGCNIYRRKMGEKDYQLIAFATSSPFIDEINESAVHVSYAAAYRSRRGTEVGPMGSPVSVAAGGAMAERMDADLAKAA